MSNRIRILMCAAVVAGMGLLQPSASAAAETSTFHGRFVSARCDASPYFAYAGVSGTWSFYLEKNGPEVMYALFLEEELHAVVPPPTFSWTFEADSTSDAYHVSTGDAGPGLFVEVWLFPGSGEFVLHVTGVPACTDFTALGIVYA